VKRAVATCPFVFIASNSSIAHSGEAVCLKSDHARILSTPCSPGRRADQFWALSGHLEKRRRARSRGISTAQDGTAECARRARITTALQTGISSEI
jgi:hypothetical protein